jgi:hypothetical protein
MVMRADERGWGFLQAMTAAVAGLGASVLSVSLALGFSDYLSVWHVSPQPDGHEAIEGLYIGAAIRFRMIYEVAAAGLLVHVCPLLAIPLKRRWFLIATSVALTAFGIAAVFLALRTKAPILAAAAATSVSLSPLSVIAVMRSGGHLDGP